MERSSQHAEVLADSNDLSSALSDIFLAFKKNIPFDYKYPNREGKPSKPELSELVKYNCPPTKESIHENSVA